MQLFALVTDRQESLHAFELMAASLAKDAIAFPQHPVGWQGGAGRFEVHWHPSQRLWTLCRRDPPRQKERARFWNCFGVADPEERGMLHITVEINPPHSGENAQLAGVFLKDRSGQLFIGHTGKVGGGRKGIGGRSFRGFFTAGEWHEIEGSRGRRREVVVFGPLDRADLAAMIAPYVHAVARFKSSVSRAD
jgi:hypothetical protein